MHKTLYLYSFHTSVYPSLLAERISVFVQQLNHSSIFGFQAPFLGAELYSIKQLASQAEIGKGGIRSERIFNSRNSFGPAEYF